MQLDSSVADPQHAVVRKQLKSTKHGATPLTCPHLQSGERVASGPRLKREIDKKGETDIVTHGLASQQQSRLAAMACSWLGWTSTVVGHLVHTLDLIH